MKAYLKTLVLTGCIAGLCACGGNGDGAQTQTRTINENNNMLNAGDHALDLGLGPDNRRPSNYGANDIHALQITDLAEDTPGVSYASCIVHGRDIIVGIQAANQLENASLEHKVKRLIQQSEPGYNIYVTSNNRMHSRIRAITEYSANPYSPSARHHVEQGQVQAEVRDIVHDLKLIESPSR